MQVEARRRTTREKGGVENARRVSLRARRRRRGAVAAGVGLAGALREEERRTILLFASFEP